MNTDRIRRRIAELDAIASSSPHADTRRDARAQAAGLRAKVPRGAAPLETPREQARPAPVMDQDAMWRIFGQAMQQATARQQAAYQAMNNQAMYNQTRMNSGVIFAEDIDSVMRGIGAFGRRSFR